MLGKSPEIKLMKLMIQKVKCLTGKISNLCKQSNRQKQFSRKKVTRKVKIKGAWGRCLEKAQKLNFIEKGKCFQTLPSLCSSKIQRNCTLVNTNVNLQLAYYILEF